MQSSQIDEIIKLKYFDWDKAKCFYYVYVFKSINKASGCLNISQSALSKKIKTLEEEVNCQLIIRGQRGVKPTRKGDELFSIIAETFFKLKGFNHNNIAMSHNGLKRKIRICATQPYAAYIFSEKLIKYNKSHPNLVFEVITDDHLIDLAINDVDMAIRPYDREAQNIIQEHLSTVEKKLFASVDYLNKYGEPKLVEDLKNHHIIASARPETFPYSDVNWILRLGMLGENLHEPVFTSSSLEAAIEAAKQGIGIVATFEEMSLVKNSDLVRVLSSIKGPLNKDFICYPKYLLKDEVFLKFKNYILEDFSYLRNENINVETS